MPRFEPDMTAVHASTPTYPRGQYLLAVRDANPIYYEKETDEGSSPVAGVRYNFEMIGKVGADGEVITEDLEGEDVAPFTCYVHSKKAYAFTKRTLLALLGYSRDEEELANEEFFSEAELWVDGEPVGDDWEATMGEGWNEPVGNEVLVNLDIEEWEGEERQRFRSFLPPKELSA